MMKIRWYHCLLAVLALAILSANGDHLFDKEIAKRQKIRSATIANLMHRQRVHFVIKKGKAEDQVFSAAGFPARENIKQDILEKVFWKINKKRYPDQLLHPGNIVEFPYAENSN